MDIRELHEWDVSPGDAARIQRELRERVSLDDGIALDDVRVVAGVDNAYSGRGKETTGHAVVVALDAVTLEVLETASASVPVAFPYVPGLLSFREAPAILAAFRNLRTAPDAVLFDGQGIAHPRRLGLAAHLGLVLDLPSAGCAKSRLVGEYEEPERVFGSQTPLLRRGEVLGAAVRTRPSHAPLFVSPGHRLSVESAVALVLRCCREERFLPEPTRLAHEMVTALRAEG